MSWKTTRRQDPPKEKVGILRLHLLENKGAPEMCEQLEDNGTRSLRERIAGAFFGDLNKTAVNCFLLEAATLTDSSTSDST